MIGVATWIASLSGWRRALFTALLGVLSVLAFAPFHFWPVLFLTMGPLVWLLDGCHRDHAALRARLKCASVTGFWFGFGYFLSGLYWVAEAFLVEPWRHGWLIPFVMTVLPAGMALFFAAAAALAMLLWRRGAARAFALAIGFGLAEYARGHVLTGLPWNLIGYAILGGEAMMQIASLFGVYALSLLGALLFVSPAAIAAPEGSNLGGGKGTPALAASLILLLGAGTLWGAQRLAQADTSWTGIKIRIVQADIDQAEKWRPENSTEIFNDYLALTKSGGLDGISLVVWPETAVPFLLADSPEALALISDALPPGTSLLVGSARVVDTHGQHGAPSGTRVFNSLLVINDKGQVLGGYDKIHLVPFGEYLPFQDFMERMGFMQLTGVRGGFSAGTGPRLLAVPGAPPAIPLICYEIIFPDEIADISTARKSMHIENRVANISERPGWMLNVTNDAWFGTSAGPYQHFQQARVRAVEQGLPLVRAANTGISAVVDPYGRILAEIGLGEKGAIDSELPKAGPQTLFLQLGPGLEISVLILAFFGWLACCVQPIRPLR